ncbi:hypothetical protein J6590_077255, partial [Homalodisca vitripennis]
MFALILFQTYKIHKKEALPIEPFVPNRNRTVHGDSSLKVADEFNEYFANVGQKLSNAIDSSGTTIDDDGNYKVKCEFDLPTATEDELLRYVGKLRGGPAP